MSSETPSPFERDFRLYLEDMVEFAEDVVAYTTAQRYESWCADSMRLDATLRKLSLIGEAATKVPESIRSLAPEVPWRKIVGTRNRLMHAYPATDLSVIWHIATHDVPALGPALGRLIERL